MAAKLPDYSQGDLPLSGNVPHGNISGVPTPVTGRALTNAKPLDVAIVDAAGNQIVSFGGGTGGSGTEYADGVVRGTATGTLAMGDDGTNIQSVKVDASGVLAIQDNGGSITVDGAFFQATQPVSGTFFQATQPVSAAALPLPAGASTSGLQTQPGVDIGDVTINNAAGAAAVNIQDGGNSVTVDGTFFQATQPVSGTFFQATQPVSLATNTPDVTDRVGRLVGVVTAANLDVALSTRLKPADTLTAITTVGTITNVVHVDDNAGSLTVDGTVAVSSVTTSITPGTAATNLGKAEDAAHTDGDVGILSLSIRRDIPNLPTAAVVSANNDYAGVATDPYGVTWVRKRQLVTYSAAYRLVDATAGQVGLTFTFTANTSKELATIYHAVGSTKTVRIRKITLTPSAGAAGIFDFEIRGLSSAAAPTTGNPAITPRQHDPADGAAEATCLALPTTPGGFVGVDSGTVSEVFSWNAAAATAQGNASGLAGQAIVLYEHKDGTETKPLIMRAGNAEGFAVNGRCTAAVALRFTVHILFTEE